MVGQFHFRHQRVHAARHHRGFHRLKPVLLTRDAGVAQAVAALIAIQRGFHRHEARRPHDAAIVDIEILSARVGRHVVVAVAGQAQHARVLIEAVTAAGVAHQGKKRLAAQIVDPGRRRLRLGDDVFTGRVVKMAVLHEVSSFFIAATARRTAGRCEIGFVLAFTFSFESNATISHFSVKIKIFFAISPILFFSRFRSFPSLLKSFCVFFLYIRV